MAENKKYYWMRMQEDFFSSKRIKKLRKLGADFVIIYLKMQLLTLQNNGYLEYDGVEDTFAEEIALDIDEDADKVQLTISFLQSCELLICNDECEYFFPYVEKNTGSETASAERGREFRKNMSIEDKEKERERVRLAVRKHREKGNELVTNSNERVTNVEKEIEKEIEIKKESKHKHGAYAHVLLTDTELEKLKTEFGADRTDKAIQYLDDYIEMKGAKYKSHYLAMRKWVFDAVDEKAKKQPAKLNQRSDDLNSMIRGMMIDGRQ